MFFCRTGKNRKRGRVWTHYLINISIVIILFIVGIFIGLLGRDNQLINKEIKTRAQGHIQHIVRVRAWNAAYGGVYVEKRAGVESNPYLVNPDITSNDGRMFTKKNPALMTREISELFQQDELVSFRMSSLHPLNPGNTPDTFERQALEAFTRGDREALSKEKQGGKTVFRYMMPLLVEEGCLECHPTYQIGDVRGGISVQFNIDAIEMTMKSNRLIMLFLGLISASIILGIIYSFTFVLMKKLDNAYLKIKALAVTDELTGLSNRRLFFSKLQDEMQRAKRYNNHLSCLLLDIDHFKQVNDVYGHQAGDLVLKEIAGVIKDSCRSVDLAARYGGEEFAVLLPDTDSAGAQITADKIRGAVAALETSFGSDTIISVTASLGVASFSPKDLVVLNDDQAIKCADCALYKAKANGRNRVELGNMANECHGLWHKCEGRHGWQSPEHPESS